jgi:GLPGLI family protein
MSAAQQAPAQLTEGIIQYQEVLKITIEMDGDMSQMAGILPNESKISKVLLFNETSSLYKNSDQEGEEEAFDTEDGPVVVQLQEPEQILFTDLQGKQQIEQRDFMSRTFLITRNIDPTQWKFTGKQKELLGYTCQEAYYEKNDKTVTAWFTPNIPIATGPDKYCGLPGMILSMEMENGDRTITATSIKPHKHNKKAIVKPKKGKKVSQEEFEKIVDEKMKEAGLEAGGGTQVLIKIEN